MSKLLGSWLTVAGSLLLAFSASTCGERVRIGTEILIQHRLDLLASKRVGIICNHTSILPNGTHIVDTLRSLGVRLTALFGPEHGVRGLAAAGETVLDTVDAKTGLPVHSLYGRVHKPTPEMLKNVDVLLFDIQDVGARFYTYASTMAYALEAAVENEKKIIVLDRPNPINGAYVEGPVLDTAFASFVGLFPIPNRHGLTLGELATLIVGEKWFGVHSPVDLTVIPMEGWKRAMWYDETRLPWISPSPNMKTLSTANVYPGMCMFEGTNVSEGRGTPKPFEYIGAPWINGDSLAMMLNNSNIPGVKFKPIRFTPAQDSMAAPNPKFKNESCGGVDLQVVDRSTFRPVRTGIRTLLALRRMYGEKLQFQSKQFDRLAGTSSIRSAIEGSLLESTRTATTFDHLLDRHLQDYLKIRKKYLLYPYSGSSLTF